MRDRRTDGRTDAQTRNAAYTRNTSRVRTVGLFTDSDKLRYSCLSVCHDDVSHMTKYRAI